ncbi:MAG TPA: hypothetical protein VGM62_17815, partial [Chthoniobacterales bacterium]
MFNAQHSTPKAADYRRTPKRKRDLGLIATATFWSAAIPSPLSLLTSRAAYVVASPRRSGRSTLLLSAFDIRRLA